jgi:hypothetical protein
VQPSTNPGGQVRKPDEALLWTPPGSITSTRAAKSKNSAHRRPSMCETTSKSSREVRPPCPLPLFSLDSRAGHATARRLQPPCRGVADGALLGVRGWAWLPVRTGSLWGNSRRYVARALPVSWRAKKLTRKHSLQSARESGSGALWRRVSQRERQRDRGSEAECPTHVARSAFSGSQRVVGDSGVP